jgi:O-antigen/teichoic acid export membrane protein
MSTTSSPSPPTEPPLADEPIRSLKSQFVSSSVWTIIGYGASQVLRFGSNLVLTRLLSPHIFGVMALVQTIINGLSYVTDVGVGPSVIQNKQGENPRFLRTAWTIQALRSTAIWLGCCLLAWPLALGYRIPDLLYALPVASFGTMITGFLSINVILLNKKLRLGPPTIVDLASQFLTIVMMIVLAYYTHSLWAVLIGTVLGALVRVVMSHCVLPGHRVGFGIDREMAASMFHFGRWITLSTMITFAWSQGDRLVLGWYMRPEALGVYSQGYQIPQAITTVLAMMGLRAIFPLASRLTTQGESDLKPRIGKVMHVLCLGFMPILWILTLFAQHIIDFLYPARFHDAGWVMRLFAAFGTIEVITTAVNPVLLSKGDSASVLKISIGRIVSMIVLVVLGGWLGGVPGLVVAFAAVPALSYPFVAWIASRSAIWLPWLDLAMIGISALSLAVGWKYGL